MRARSSLKAVHSGAAISRRRSSAWRRAVRPSDMRGRRQPAGGRGSARSRRDRRSANSPLGLQAHYARHHIVGRWWRHGRGLFEGLCPAKDADVVVAPPDDLKSGRHASARKAAGYTHYGKLAEEVELIGEVPADIRIDVAPVDLEVGIQWIVLGRDRRKPPASGR